MHIKIVKKLNYLINLDDVSALRLLRAIENPNACILRDYTESKGQEFFEHFFEKNHANLTSYDVLGVHPTVAHEGWILGRENYRDRVRNKLFTPAELEFYNTQSERVSKMWSNVDPTDRKARTSNGLSVRNAKIHTCVHCGKSGLTLGNLGRWHNDKCKLRKGEIDSQT